MQGIISKVQTIGMLIALVSTIGAGFYAYGVFNNRLDVLETKEYTIEQKVDLSGLNKEIKELNEKINNRVNALGTAHEDDYISLIDSQAADHNEVMDLIRLVESSLEALKGDVAINEAAIEYLDAKIEEYKAAQSNPLLQ